MSVCFHGRATCEPASTLKNIDWSGWKAWPPLWEVQAVQRRDVQVQNQPHSGVGQDSLGGTWSTFTFGSDFILFWWSSSSTFWSRSY